MPTPVEELDERQHLAVAALASAPPLRATPEQGAPPPPPQAAANDKPRRINVAVTPDAIAALEKVIAREGVTLTEAVRRLLNYGHFVYSAVKEDGGSLELHAADGTTKNVVFI